MGNHFRRGCAWTSRTVRSAKTSRKLAIHYYYIIIIIGECIYNY